jgi:PhnB protein
MQGDFTMAKQSEPQSLSPYLSVKGARAAIDFYVAAFGATELFALVDPADGRIGHGEIQFGSSTVMISDEYPDFGALSPETLGGSPVKLHLYVEDADATFGHAVSLGATELRPMKDQFHGGRSGLLADPFGYQWVIARKAGEVSPAEMQARWNAGMEE